MTGRNTDSDKQIFVLKRFEYDTVLLQEWDWSLASRFLFGFHLFA